MTRSFDFESVDRVTAGAVGEPGQRVFFVQARQAGEECTVLAEKDQVAILGQALLQLVDSLPEGPEGVEPAGDELELEEPLEPQWRAGEMSIQYDELTDRIVIVISELVADGAEEVEPETARLVVTRAQARALGAHALDVVAAGRPRCQFCGLPMEPEDTHVCPAMNGHRSLQND